MDNDEAFEKFKECAVEVLQVPADKVTRMPASPKTSKPTASTWWSW